MGGPRKDVGDGLRPPPEVHVCGKRVAPDADPAEQWNGGGGGRRGKSAFQLGRGPAEIVSYPGTVLLLVINLAFAYHLWAKRVSEVVDNRPLQLLNVDTCVLICSARSAFGVCAEPFEKKKMFVRFLQLFAETFSILLSV